MCESLHLAPTGHPPVPDDIVTLTVDVDTTNCGAPISQATQDTLIHYRQNGIHVPVSRIVAYAGIHYRCEAVDHWHIGSGRAEMQNAWQDISNRHPHCVTDANGNLRLLFVRSANSRRQANFTEAAGVGVGLFVATRFFQTPYRFWNPTPALSAYDYRAFANTSMEYQLEARGRFNGNLGNAKSEVWSKFGANSTLSHQLGVIFCPRDTITSAHPDVILMDPVNDGPALDTEYPEFRATIRHYAYLFARQNFHSFSKRLFALANADESEFRTYLKSGDQILKKALAKRTSFRLGSNEFQGTAWKGFAWPGYLSSKLSQHDFSEGYFYWGIWAKLIECLREGRIHSIAEMTIEEQVVKVANQVNMILDDATALAWAPTLRELLEMA